MNARSISWPEVALGEVCEFKYGKSLPESKRAGGKVAVYGSNGVVGQHNEAITDGLTIVVGRKGSFGEINLSHASCWPIDTTYYIDRTATNADLRWLAYRLTALGLTDLNKAAAVPGLNREDAYRKRLLLPPLAEQWRIAAILDQAEALRAKRRHALTQLDTLTQSLFLDLFGDPVNNPKSWPKQPMGKLMNIRRGGSPRPIEQFLGGTINWVKIGDATSGDDIYISHCADKIIEAGLKKTVYLKAGSLIFANCGVSLGFARILKIDGCIHDGWLSLADVPEDRLDKLFLLKALNAITTRFRKMAPEGTQPNLNTDLIKSFPIVLPPLPLQHEFAAQVSAVERLKKAQRASLAKLDALFASLQHRAFRGEL